MLGTMKNEFCHLSLSSIQVVLGLQKQKVGLLPRNPSFGTEKRVVSYRERLRVGERSSGMKKAGPKARRVR